MSAALQALYGIAKGDAIIQDFSSTEREMPVDIDAVYKGRKEALA